MDKPNKPIKPGVYLTDYGNAAEVDPDNYGPYYAFDLDMQEEIPIELVDLTQFIRDLD